MPTSMLSPLDLPNAATRRVPKLTVRSRLVDEAGITDASQSSEDSSNTESQRFRLRTALTPSTGSYPKSPNNVTQNNYDDHSRNGSSGSQGRERPHRHQASKKKSNGVLGFLTLKEPSTSALEEFAEHEKRKAAQKGAKSIAMVMPGVSSQKLPDHVPKVNSKWDGLPETAKRKATERREREPGSPLDIRNFSLSRSSSGRGMSTNRPYGSLSRKPSIRRSQDKKRFAVEVMEVGDEGSMFPVVHPALRKGSTFSTASTPDDLDLPDLSGYTITSPEASPRIPALDTAMPMPALRGPYSPVKAPDMGASWASDSDEVTIKSAGPNVLALPKIRTPANYHPVTASATNAEPALRSPRTLSIPTFTYSATPVSPATSDRLMPLPSSSSGSSASSGMSAQWKSPPKERLSLGPQIRKEQVLPWEMFDGPSEESEPRLSSASKPKRFSYKLSRK